jgi:hypothetical protein
MKNFIRLSRACDNTPIYVKPSAITAVFGPCGPSHPDSHAEVTFLPNGHVELRESVEAIVSMVDESV